MKFQRDELINSIYDYAINDKSIYFLSADFGAPALDKFRKNLPDQFIHCGISEQHMVDLAVGLALEGNKVFCYAMAPFVSLRCLEQHKCGASIMKLPIITIVAGVGFSYADAGPTHYATEDLACLRAMIGSNIYTASDGLVSKKIVEKLLKNPEFSFIRLDRDPSNDYKPLVSNENIENGYRIFGSTENKLAILTSGYLVGKTLSIINDADLYNKFLLIDLIKQKPFPKIDKVLSSTKKILIIDEQTSYGGLSSAFLEYICDNQINIETNRMCIPDKHFFENGGRDVILKRAGLGHDDIKKKILDMI